MADVQVVERKLAAIFAADVAEYSRLMGLDEVGTLRRLQAYRVILDQLIAAHRGRIFNTAGDSVVADFASAVDAVECAVAVQQAIEKENENRPAGEQMRFRIGIHLGDVIVDGDNLFGDGVNIAARLQALAEPGGICLSGAVRDQIGSRLPIGLTALGEQRVKNIAAPVRAFRIHGAPGRELPRTAGRRRRVIARGGLVAIAVLALLIAAGAVWRLWPGQRSETHPASATVSATQPNTAPRLSIVVLPFTNLSNDPQQEYFADGITEDLTTDVARIQGSTVIARNTAFTYKGKAVDARQIGRELGVRYVLEGSVQRAGNQVRINAQLVNTETGAQIWGDRFDRNAADLFALQNEITARIARALQSQLAIAEARRPTDHPDALDFILRGRAVLTQPISKENSKEAVKLFEAALAVDPQSADAATWLAAALAFRVTDELSDSPDEDLHRAEKLVAQALATSPNSALAHYVKGQVLFAQSRCGEAIPEYEQAISLDRSRAPAYARLGWCKFLTGAVEQAIPYFEQAIHLSPHERGIASWYGRMGVIYLLQSRTDEAIGWLERANSENAGLAFVHAYLAAGYALKGETERARSELAEAKRLSNLYSSLARVQKYSWYENPKVRALAENTYFPGLRRAGMPEE
ncbi:MAG: adenylate/guanylate cyclase domain-containing protein [Alphaproteobacteria bacterium]|nr:adenylate/guanylate cyclase domain-containing protein [Alphaproteobacteria bacterium]